ncbi:spidroin-2-like isoform X2 [Malaya genurostris]|uniref:spidroin-2-like isoform X2 n=1 Tax=Malaya genurostris TaxID=325434 RepID=UPI0026F408E4|nr:spidroin-2-like isoform X2 [Malaya genurostris]
MNTKYARALMLKCYLFVVMLVSINAEEKWSWSKNDAVVGNNNLGNGNNDKLNVRSDVIEFQEPKRFNDDIKDYRQGRYEVKESATKKPYSGRPLSDEFSGEENSNKPSDFGLNQRFGGLNNGQYPINPYGINPGYGGGNPYFGGGGGIGYPQQGFGGYYGGAGYGGANGILVGPEGPTGIIGRPNKGYPGGYPGGGYGPYGNNFGGGYGGHNGFSNQGGFGRPGGFYPQAGIGGYPGGGYYAGQGGYGPGQFGSGPFGVGQFGPGQFNPGQFGSGQYRPGGFGGGPFGPQFDQAKQSTKKIEKKSI